MRTVVSGSTVGFREIGSRIRSGGKKLGRPGSDHRGTAPGNLPWLDMPSGIKRPAISSGAVFSRSCFGILTIMRSDPRVRSQARRSDFAACVS